ncbi:hypothetical protein ACVWYH_005546 [Bradyrhizobium sp. GM24.11]
MARLTPAEQIEQSYDDTMKALADYLTRERDAATTINRLIQILDQRLSMILKRRASSYYAAACVAAR